MRIYFAALTLRLSVFAGNRFSLGLGRKGSTVKQLPENERI